MLLVFSIINSCFLWKLIKFYIIFFPQIYDWHPENYHNASDIPAEIRDTYVQYSVHLRCFGVVSYILCWFLSMTLDFFVCLSQRGHVRYCHHLVSIVITFSYYWTQTAVYRLHTAHYKMFIFWQDQKFNLTMDLG